MIDDLRTQIFENLPFSERSKKDLEESCVYILRKDTLDVAVMPFSGVVIAGFGEKEIYPSVESYTLGFVIEEKLKYRKDNSKCVKIGQKARSSVIPFAQDEMVRTFMEGTNLTYAAWQVDYLAKMFDEFIDMLIHEISPSPSVDPKGFLVSLKKSTTKLLKDFIDNSNNYRRSKHIEPITRAVSNLPKEELATMAETLVNLTCFRLRVSLENETVGGPVDVAVISKGDGFIWIKRKHYFKPELNHHFFSNYYRRSQKQGGSNESKPKEK